MRFSSTFHFEGEQGARDRTNTFRLSLSWRIGKVHEGSHPASQLHDSRARCCETVLLNPATFTLPVNCPIIFSLLGAGTLSQPHPTRVCGLGAISRQPLGVVTPHFAWRPTILGCMTWAVICVTVTFRNVPGTFRIVPPPPVTQLIISLEPLGVESGEKLWDEALTELRQLAPSEVITSHSHFRNEVLGQTLEQTFVK